MTYMDVLEKWAVYSKYDREQKSFNLMNMDYTFHTIGKQVEKLLSEYDSTGMLAVLYVKRQFELMLTDAKISLLDVLVNPNSYKDEKDMYAMFNEDVVVKAENEFIGKLNQIYLQVTKDKLIGENKEQKQQILDSIGNVVNSINKCKVDMFAKGGRIKAVTHVDTQLHVFNTLAECLLTIEKSEDSIYFCFISAGDSADCFFAFFLKSNGTIISVSDRIDEVYIGQHGNLRNGRWTEAKADNIFPYNYIFNYSGHDYKGYATKYELKKDKLDLYNLGVEAFMPIIVGMLLVMLKFTDKEVELQLHYLDSFLPENRAKIEKYELMIVNDSSIACKHDEVDIAIDNKMILSGAYAQEFDYDKKGNDGSNVYGIFNNNNQLMVDLWGEGFEFDCTSVFKKSNIQYLTDKTDDSYVPEFIGTEKAMRLQVYYDARKQLAEYMDNKIYDAWVEFGKTKAVKEWYKKALLENKEAIYRMLMEYETAVEKGEKKNLGEGWVHTDGSICIYIQRDEKYPSSSSVGYDDIINGVKKADAWERLDDINYRPCNLWFIIKPQSWKQIETLTNQEVPKIVKGWICGRRHSGNSLLDVTDAVEDVQTPFEHRNFSLTDKYYGAYYEFTVAFGFSKSGWKELKKTMIAKDSKQKE